MHCCHSWATRILRPPRLGQSNRASRRPRRTVHLTREPGIRHATKPGRMFVVAHRNSAHCSSTAVAVISPGHPSDRRQSEPSKITVWGGAERHHAVTRAQRAPLTVILVGSRLERQGGWPLPAVPCPAGT